MQYISFFYQVGLEFDESVVVRVTGCPNGCARPYMAEVGLVGDGPNSYQVITASIDELEPNNNTPSIFNKC